MGIPTENEKGAIYSKLQTVDDVGLIKGRWTKLVVVGVLDEVKGQCCCYCRCRCRRMRKVGN